MQLGVSGHVLLGCALGSSSLCIIPSSEPLVGSSFAPMAAEAWVAQCHGEVASASCGMIRTAWAFASPVARGFYRFGESGIFIFFHLMISIHHHIRCKSLSLSCPRVDDSHGGVHKLF